MSYLPLLETKLCLRYFTEHKQKANTFTEIT